MFIKAQLTTSSKEYQSAIEPDTDIDLVTVGSIMPYKVAPFNWKLYSDIVEVPIYKWWLNGNATGYKLLKCDGATPLKQLPPPNHVYYPDSSISIQWIKSGKYTLRVSEKVLTKKGIQLCGPAETIQTLDVEVIDRPLVTWPDTSYLSGCNLDGTIQNITFNITATKTARVGYKVEYIPMGSSLTKSFTSDKEFKLPQGIKEYRGSIPVSIPEKKYGIYKIYITGVCDKVSEKCGIKCQEEDYPTAPFVLEVRQGKDLSLFDNKTPQTCQDVPYELKPVLPFSSIVWSNGARDSSIRVTEAGYYSAEAVLKTGCVIRDSVLLDVLPNPVFSLGNDTSICGADELVLDPGVSALSYAWSTGETTSSIRVNAGAGLVWALIADYNGCAASDTVLVTSCDPHDLLNLIPNTFTPNGDFDNDSWKIGLLENYPAASVIVYNRWGQMVYKADGNYPSAGWNGMSNGRELPMSTYFFVIDLKNGTAPIVGSVNLIR